MHVAVLDKAFLPRKSPAREDEQVSQARLTDELPEAVVAALPSVKAR